MIKRILMGVGAVAIAMTMAFTPSLQAHASSGYGFTLVNPGFSNGGGIDTYNCMRDDGDAPWNHVDQRLANCDASQEAELYAATPSSYGTGWDSVVLGNQTRGNYCLTAVANSDGAYLEPLPCNGSSSQAWKDVCVPWTGNPGGYTWPEVVNADGYAWNDYGGYDSPGDHIEVWHFENPAPSSLWFMGPQLQTGCSGTGGLP